jgi:hypothetical protein
VNATKTDRRRNMRAEGCKVCGAHCESGAGYLYKDTNTFRRNHRTGGFLWFVKCETCHGGNKTRLTLEMERNALKHANDPVVHAWSVTQVKKWVVSRVTHEGDVAIKVTGKGVDLVVSYRDPISSRFSAPTGYSLEQKVIADKPLSKSAANHLGDRILAVLCDVQAEEAASAEAAVTRLRAAGAAVVACPSGCGWRVDFGGHHYTMWGCVGGDTRICGYTPSPDGGLNRFVDTTVEKLLEPKGESCSVA